MVLPFSREGTQAPHWVLGFGTSSHFEWAEAEQRSTLTRFSCSTERKHMHINYIFTFSLEYRKFNLLILYSYVFYLASEKRTESWCKEYQYRERMRTECEKWMLLIHWQLHRFVNKSMNKHQGNWFSINQPGAQSIYVNEDKILVWCLICVFRALLKETQSFDSSCALCWAHLKLGLGLSSPSPKSKRPKPSQRT